jgi:hydrogenase small subunit
MMPMYDRLPHVQSVGHDLTADKIGLGLVGAAFAGATAHGIAKSVQQKRYLAAGRAESAGTTPTVQSANEPNEQVPPPSGGPATPASTDNTDSAVADGSTEKGAQS